MSHSSQRLRKFRFNRPQQVAAVLLALLLGQCLWVAARCTLSEQDYRFARCGREMWEKPSPLAGYFTSCGNIHDGTLAYRAAGLPLTIERIFAGQASNTSTWEMRHELRWVGLLLRLPFIGAALALGGCLWWVTRRLFGNVGGYIALSLYCFSPPVIAAAVAPNNEIWAAYGLFAAVYTAIGVSHAMQGPRRKWRPRIVLLTVIFGITAAAHLSAFLIALLLSLAFMAYLAEGKRAYLPTLLILWTLGAFAILFAFYGFRPEAFSYAFRSDVAAIRPSLDAARALFRPMTDAGIALAAAAAVALWAAMRRSRYFGNSTPLAVAVLLLCITTTGVPTLTSLWALPFVLTFVGGVFADVLELEKPRSAARAWRWITVAIVLCQAALCVAGLPLLVQ
ncbi:hypothetical protein [Silvibacterium sp.]|uniref:hypothetical protein n=1 Tax=Silvibacterium sp. TaxID=1964179 RepID=UPI0039E2A034